VGSAARLQYNYGSLGQNRQIQRGLAMSSYPSEADIGTGYL
jgi:hypothetical protein